MYLRLDLTVSCLLPLLKYYFSPFTHNGKSSSSICLHLPNNLLKYMIPSSTHLTFKLPEPSILSLFCCYFVADGEKSTVWRWENDPCLSVLFGGWDLSGRTYSWRDEGGGDHQGKHVMSSLFLLPGKSEAFLYLVPSVLKVVEMEFYFLFFCISYNKKSTPKFICGFIFHSHK